MLTKLVLLCATAVLVKGFSSGAPESPQICESLIPKHPGSPQTVPSPYKVTLDSDRVKAGGTLGVNLIADQPDVIFKGFLVQARKSNYERETTPVSRFLVENSPEYRPLNCGDDNNAITHTDSQPKSSVHLKWVAPLEPGTYVMLATFVQDGKTYWVKQPSTTNVTVV